MRIETACAELAVSRHYLHIETRTFALFWDFTARPLFERKTRAVRT